MSCQNCNRTFSSEKNLKYHIEHNVCQKSNKKCEKCGHIFTSKTMLKYHIEHNVCNIKIKPKITLKKELTEKYKDYSKEELILKVANLEGQNQALIENPRNVNNNILVFPSAYGKEDINMICKKMGDILGPLIKYHTSNSIPYLFEKMHTTKQLPEYHNVYTTSEKSNFALVSDGEKFRNRPKRTVIDQIIEDKKEILSTYVDKNDEQLGEAVLSKYEEYHDKVESDPTFRRNLEMEIGGLLLDMKAIIADDDKTRRLLKKVDEGNFELDAEDNK